jgi:hypothetical protein
MKVHYRGPVDRVSVPLPNGRQLTVAKGKDIDLGEHLPKAEADALGKSLLEQPDNWTPVADGPDPATPEKAPAADEKGGK